jgi:hypothetical protein
MIEAGRRKGRRFLCPTPSDDVRAFLPQGMKARSLITDGRALRRTLDPPAAPWNGGKGKARFKTSSRENNGCFPGVLPASPRIAALDGGATYRFSKAFWRGHARLKKPFTGE